MKTIGVLGGMSSFATAEYYRQMNAAVNMRRGGHAAAEVVIFSVDPAPIVVCIHGQRWDDAARLLADGAQAVERAGAAFLILATNTLHRVASQLQSVISIPLIHIVDVTAGAAVADRARRLGVLGTGPVMEPGFYSDRFAQHGIELVAPDPADRALVERVVTTELVRGEVRAESTAAVLDVIGNLVTDGVEGVVLGCTELGLMITPETEPGTRVYDTTRLHVEAAVRLSLELDPLPPPSKG